MKKAILVLMLLAVSAIVFAQAPAAITEWTIVEDFVMGVDPFDSTYKGNPTQMAGGEIVGDYLYLIGGHNLFDTDTTRCYKFAIDQYTGDIGEAIEVSALPDSGATAYLEETVVATDSAIYISGGGYNVGGPNLNNVTYATASANGNLTPWSSSATFPNANGDTNPYDPELGGAAICDNGYIYCFGGDGENVTTFTDCFYAQIQGDGSLGAWTRGTDLPDTFWFPGVATIGNYIIVTGGILTDKTRANATDKVWVCEVNTDGSMGAWVEQTNALPEARYCANFVAVDNTVFCLGGRNNSDGTGQVNVWRTTFDSSAAAADMISAWSDSVDVQLPYGVRYHDAAYSDASKSLYILSIRTDRVEANWPDAPIGTGVVNEALISSPLYDRPVPTKAAAWSIYQ